MPVYPATTNVGHFNGPRTKDLPVVTCGRKCVLERVL